MIKVSDLNMIGSQHLVVNASMLKIIREIFMSEEIVFFSEETHWSEINKIINIENVVYSRINVGSRGNKRFFKKFILEFINVLKLLSNRSGKSDLIIILSLFSNMQPVLKLLVKYFFKHTNVILLQHGELEGLIDESSNKITKYGYWIRKYFQIKRPSNLYSIVLGDSIKENLKDIVGENKNLMSINHPYIFNYAQHELKDLKGKIKIGIIGEVSIKKGGKYFIEIANIIKNAKINKMISFEIVGKIKKCLKDQDFGDIFIHNFGNKQISQENFEVLASKLNYACYLYPHDSYKLIASGAIFDAIKFGIPIIAIKNDYFDEIFKNSGDVGFFFKDYTELKNSIVDVITNNNNQRYQTQIKNINLLKNKFTTSTIRDKFKQELLDKGLICE